VLVNVSCSNWRSVLEFGRMPSLPSEFIVVCYVSVKHAWVSSIRYSLRCNL
jgi:hypothetical protein